jgi:uncharacterized protein
MSAVRAAQPGWRGTLLWAVAILAVYELALLIGLVAAAHLLGVPWPWQEREWSRQLAAVLGSAMALGSLPASLIGLWLLWVVVRGRALTPREYLALRPLRLRLLLSWLVAAALASWLLNLLSDWLQRPIPDSMQQLYQSTRTPWVLWIAVVAGAPLVEELVFRGFVYRGFAASALRPLGAIVLASLGWALLHQQYEPFEILQLFVLGLLLGAARWHTGSVWAPVAMHALVNALAIAQLEALIGGV